MTTTNLNDALGIKLPSPYASISRRQINAWKKSRIGVYSDDCLTVHNSTPTDSFLASLFFEGCAEEFGGTKDGSRHFRTAAGRLVRIYSKSLIRALRKRIKEAEEALDKLRKHPKFKIAIAKLCGIPYNNDSDILRLIDAEFTSFNINGHYELHLLYGSSDYIFSLPSWVENYKFLRRCEILASHTRMC